MSYASILPNPFIDEVEVIASVIKRATRKVAAETARRKKARNGKVVANKRARR